MSLSLSESQIVSGCCQLLRVCDEEIKVMSLSGGGASWYEIVYYSEVPDGGSGRAKVWCGVC